MNPDEARARVRETGGDELVDRLDALEASRGPRPPDAALRAPDVGTHADVDVVIAGGGLALLLAPALARRGLTVAVLDRGRIGAVHREWNASAPELRPLVTEGIVTEAELDALVVARYDRGFCRWHGGGTWPVRGVLDHAIEAAPLLTRVRARAMAAGVHLHDQAEVDGIGPGPGGVLVRTRDGGTLVGRLFVDARGAASPLATADLVCPTVGGVLGGLAEGDGPDEIDPRVGEILVTTEGVEGGRQHLWEAFPGRAGEVTTYLFTYARAETVAPGALLALYARFFENLPGYKRGDARLLRPTFGYIPGWSRLRPGPVSPHPRIVLFGDVAARHSPLTYCGFGRMLRSFGPAADRIARSPDAPGEIYAPEPIHAGTGALSRMLSDPPTRDPAAMNALLDVAFGALFRGGEAYYARMLRDEMTMAEFVAFLWRTSLQRPQVYRDVFTSLGVADVARWGAGVVAGLGGSGR